MADADKRAENNREKKNQALRRFHALLELAARPGFCGTIAVEISSKDGVMGRPKYTQVEFEPDAS